LRSTDGERAEPFWGDTSMVEQRGDFADGKGDIPWRDMSMGGAQ